MSKKEIRKKIKELKSEKAVYDQMDEEDKFNCDHYEAYDLIRGQLEAYENVLMVLEKQKRTKSARLKEFLKEWWFLRETAIKTGFVLGCLFETLLFIISLITVAVIA